MTASWQPPSRMSHVRVFLLCLLLFVAFLAFLLFGARMEAVAPATGIVTARDLREVRTTLTGLIEPGWYEGQLNLPGVQAVAVRLDGQGNGTTDPAAGPVREITNYQARESGQRGNVARDSLRFHRLQAGDILWAGQVLGWLRIDEWRHELDILEATDDFFTPGGLPSPRRIRRETLKNWLGQAVLRAPNQGQIWQAISVNPVPLQSVSAGDLVALLVPLDPETRQPRDLMVRLQIDEGHLADIAVGQLVHISSSVYNQRLYGSAEAVIERIEPWGELGFDNQRRYVAFATLRESAFHPPLGSTCQAKIVVGKKPVYRIILEH